MDRTSDGRSFRMLTLIDEHFRECLAIDVARRLTSEDVLERLSDLFVRRGVPTYLRSDNGKLGKPGSGMFNGRACDRRHPFPLAGVPTMRLMAIDLGKFKSVACLYCGEDDVTYRTIEIYVIMHQIAVKSPARCPIDSVSKGVATEKFICNKDWVRHDGSRQASAPHLGDASRHLANDPARG
jgi:hypothetical protein